MTGWADVADAGRSSGVTGTDDDDPDDGAPNNLNKLGCQSSSTGAGSSAKTE